MKKNVLQIVISLILFIGCHSIKSDKTEMEKEEQLYIESSQKADSLITQMTIDEKILLLGGVDYFYSNEISRLGIIRVLMTDATGGLHLRDEFEGKKYTRPIEKSTAFPAPIVLSATWNRELAYDYAKSIGEECRAAGIPVLLGPGMNIYRVSQCGRNFEYFGEDPYLTSRMIENYVSGVQSTGTIATLKHFVANNTDFFRRKSNSIVDERTLHEIYLPGFKAGIDAGAKAVMTAYNLVNGEWCGESKTIIDSVLRKELGFKWMVMTDWWSVYDGKKLIKSGQNIEMPSAQSTKDVLTWLNEGVIKEAEIDAMIKPQIATFIAMDSYNRKPEKKYLESFNHHEQIALQTAREGIVLLKNEGVLPISKDLDNVLAMGYFMDEDLKGGGSAEVKGYNHVSLRKALMSQFGDNVNIVEEPSDDQIKEASTVILSVGTYDSEGYDRPFELPLKMEELINKVVRLNSKTVVLVSSGSGIRMTDWNDEAAAILYCWYPGQIGFHAVGEILSGEVNPSGKLPMTIEKEFLDSPAYGYMNDEPFYVGWNGAGERAHPIYDVKYDEGIFVGYRWFDHKNIEPLYSFGHGLTYASFEIEDGIVKVDDREDDVEVTVEVSIKNRSSYDGAQTLQVYIKDVESSEVRPEKELKGFEKVFMKAGETKKVILKLSAKDFSFYDSSMHKWVLETGEFEMMIGFSSKDIKSKYLINL